MDEREARLGLSCVVEPGTAKVAAAIAEYGAGEVWQGLLRLGGRNTLGMRAREFRPEPVLARAAALEARFVIPGDPEWPPQLAELDGCEPVNGLSGVPCGLWLQGAGDLAELAGRSVAVVGSRACTSYGETVATELAADLGDAGFSVVSGGAFGIDAAAHRGSLVSRTPGVAILAAGLDQAYPAAHRPLFDRIAERGVLVSELPPGEHPTRVRFLGRNRLIAALTQATVLVEAAVRSGGRNTVTWATSLRRVVAAVPGPVTSALSFTPHRLIREAEAVLVTTAGEILELVSPLGRPAARPPSEHRPTDDLGPDELRVYEAVPARGSLTAGELSLRSGVVLASCLLILDELEGRGMVLQNDRLEWRLPPRRRPAEPLPFDT
ncbi:MAG: DNA-protecting protein DprA [Propionicimonas sp.]|nr:DNA-protecting protein DprA [Propionicimonas sp.]